MDFIAGAYRVIPEDTGKIITLKNLDRTIKAPYQMFDIVEWFDYCDYFINTKDNKFLERNLVSAEEYMKENKRACVPITMNTIEECENAFRLCREFIRYIKNSNMSNIKLNWVVNDNTYSGNLCDLLKQMVIIQRDNKIKVKSANVIDMSVEERRAFADSLNVSFELEGIQFKPTKARNILELLCYFICDIETYGLRDAKILIEFLHNNPLPNALCDGSFEPMNSLAFDNGLREKGCLCNEDIFYKWCEDGIFEIWQILICSDGAFGYGR